MSAAGEAEQSAPVDMMGRTIQLVDRLMKLYNGTVARTMSKWTYGEFLAPYKESHAGAR